MEPRLYVKATLSSTTMCKLTAATAWQQTDIN